VSYVLALATGLSVTLIFLALIAEQARRRKYARLEIATQTAIRDFRGPPQGRLSQLLIQYRSVQSTLIRQHPLLRFFDDRLFSANLKIGVISLLVLYAVTGATAGYLALASGFPPVAVALMVFIFPPVLIGLLVERRVTKRQLQFEREMPEFLLLVSSSLASGLSLNQAMESIAFQGTGEIERQFRRASRETSMGVQLEDALEDLRRRTKSSEMAIFIATISTHREVGGNLSQTLEATSVTLRERLGVANDIRVLSSDGRYSAMFLTLLPFAVFAFFYIFNPGYVSFFWTEPVGFLLAFGSILLTLIGVIWIRLIVRVRI